MSKYTPPNTNNTVLEQDIDCTPQSGEEQPSLKGGLQQALQEIETYSQAQHARLSATPKVLLLDPLGQPVYIKHSQKKGRDWEEILSPAYTQNPGFAELRRKVYSMKASAFAAYA